MMDDPLIQRVLSTVIQDFPTPVDNNDETRTERQIDNGEVDPEIRTGC